MVTVELAPQVLSARAGNGLDVVREEIALHDCRLEHQLVDQRERGVDRDVRVDHRVLRHHALPFSRLRLLPEVGDLLVTAGDGA